MRTTRLVKNPVLDEEDLRPLRLLATGVPLETVARRSGMSERTVRRRIRAICDRPGVTAPIQAVGWAARRGVL
ncbi:hypothetical protein ACH4T9_03110 [Micromonospora sp. NPDC020750]|uniref:hypothetical protein n=1 Tax=unclassified Micromonospora TaxID=2617518 RepID=UPI003791D945